MKKIASLFALVFAANASATVLTFDGNGTLSNEYPDSYRGIGDTYTQDGYTLTVGVGDHFDRMTSNGIYFHDAGANSQSDNYAYLTFDNGLFDLISFDITSYQGELKTNLGTYTQHGIGHHTVNLTGLTWAAFSGRSSLYLDNVAVRASNVPEPSGLALLGLGLLGLGYRNARSRN